MQRTKTKEFVRTYEMWVDGKFRMSDFIENSPDIRTTIKHQHERVSNTDDLEMIILNRYTGPKETDINGNNTLKIYTLSSEEREKILNHQRVLFKEYTDTLYSDLENWYRTEIEKYSNDDAIKRKDTIAQNLGYLLGYSTTQIKNAPFSF